MGRSGANLCFFEPESYIQHAPHGASQKRFLEALLGASRSASGKLHFQASWALIFKILRSSIFKQKLQNEAGSPWQEASIWSCQLQNRAASFILALPLWASSNPECQILAASFKTKLLGSLGDTWQFQRQVSCKRNGGTVPRKRWERIRIHGGMRVPFANLTWLWNITIFNW